MALNSAVTTDGGAIARAQARRRHRPHRQHHHRQPAPRTRLSHARRCFAPRFALRRRLPARLRYNFRHE